MSYFLNHFCRIIPLQSLPFGFPDASDGKESSCNAGGPGSIPGFERSPGEGSDYPFQYSCLGNPMDRGAWRAIQFMGPQICM